MSPTLGVQRGAEARTEGGLEAEGEEDEGTRSSAPMATLSKPRELIDAAVESEVRLEAVDPESLSLLDLEVSEMPEGPNGFSRCSSW